MPLTQRPTMRVMLDRFALLLLPVALTISLTGCGPSFSPDTYASAAAQLANKVDQGVIVGVRVIGISADASLGTATGAAAGGIAGSQVGEGAGGALGALGGSVAGGIVGNAVAHAAGDTEGYEYIVRKPNGDLLSVTQKDTQPIEIGTHVLVIEGPQARIVVDYTVPVDAAQSRPADSAKTAAQPALPPAELSKNSPAATVSSASAASAQVTATPLPAPPVLPPPADVGGDKKPVPEGSTAPKPVDAPAASAPGTN